MPDGSGDTKEQLTAWPEATHWRALCDAVHEYREGVLHEYWSLSDPCFDDDPRLPKPLAWVLAPWRPLMWRFSRHNLERLLRPKLAERRQDWGNFNQGIFWCGWSDLSPESVAYMEELMAEFGDQDTPPRDWEPMSVAEVVGVNMGMTREEVAEIVAR
jgi:hypothetical protein